MDDRSTRITKFDERNLPKRLHIDHGPVSLTVNYAYDLQGQRIKKHSYSSRAPAGEDPHYSFERDGERLVGV